MYLKALLKKYMPRDLNNYSNELSSLKSFLSKWAGPYYKDIILSGSRQKGTAIALASDIDFLISLENGCYENQGGLKAVFENLHKNIVKKYQNVRKQNVSFRLHLFGNTLEHPPLEVDITPAIKLPGNTNHHSVWVSKLNTRKQTNIHMHINDVLNSGRRNEIKLLKIWKVKYALDFPSVYLEYLLIDNILYGRSKNPEHLSDNFLHVLRELARDENNPLFYKIVDPANPNNILSDLVTDAEKRRIISMAKFSIQKQYWNEVFA